MYIFQFEFQMKGIIGIKVTISHITEKTLPMMQAILKTRMILLRILVYPTMKHLQTQTIVTLVKQVSNSIFTKIVKHCELSYIKLYKMVSLMTYIPQFQMQERYAVGKKEFLTYVQVTVYGKERTRIKKKQEFAV